MNRKEKSLSANCPQKTGMVILNQNNYFLNYFLNSWSILRKIYSTESELSKIAPVTLLKSPIVMGNSLETSKNKKQETTLRGRFSGVQSDSLYPE